MIRLLSRWILVIVTVFGLAGCRVDEDFLDSQLFECGTDSDCGPGWGCIKSFPVTPDFCAPLCGEAPCDGVCTGGDRPQCLQACRIQDDGSTTDCGPEFNCIRTTVERGEGVCYPVETCEVHSDCASNERCLTQLFEDGSPASVFAFDQLYCLPVSTPAEGCPSGYKTSELDPSETRVCRPACSIADPSCPLGFACSTTLQRVAPLLNGVSGPLCDIGSYGLTCQDDTNCLVGRCLDPGSAQERMCTLTCDEASRLASGCGNLITQGSLEWIFSRMECDRTAPSDDGSGLCVVRHALSFPGCTREPGGAYPCQTGLSCRPFDFQGGALDLCTKECVNDQECNLDFGEDERRWLNRCAGGFCMYENLASELRIQ
ncbi:MAG: hypothetical protein AAGF12_25450 [Myxococcota bacterium]